ncbi:Brp/Blh family beta-carotene 15,15'-dioxygenase [Curtobacterium ammoniigenes]|uniref:Brp/Blh family beta-carotene 15,15'-dioxygenase n=1 Tax=Curtobacterium ammoniigenes TaxID=395387 RepID=UPI00082B9DFF|nr:Brp/Blh family beta-carotene 15,15'-dioxygenase [Curtobacterium ammoniigenes]
MTSVPDVLRASRTGGGDATAGIIANRILSPVTVTFAILTVIVGGLELAGWRVPAALQVVPFAVSILVFGLPHGALDHLVPARVAGVDRVRGIAAVCGLYLVLGAVTAGLWATAPIVAFATFIALTWFHWGQGDLWIDRMLGDGRGGRAAAILTVAARGSIPMLIPLAARPADYRAVLDQTVRAVAPGVTPHASLLSDVLVRALAVALVVVLIAIDAVINARAGLPLWRRLTETAVLVAFFAAVPPVLAVGLYFTLWHSVRHILRLELLTVRGRADIAAGRLGRPLLRFFRDAWPVTAIAVAMLIALGTLLRRADLGVYLVLIAALTTPHAVVVSWMDRRQRVWRRVSSPAGAVGHPLTAAGSRCVRSDR